MKTLLNNFGKHTKTTLKHKKVTSFLATSSKRKSQIFPKMSLELFTKMKTINLNIKPKMVKF